MVPLVTLDHLCALATYFRMKNVICEIAKMNKFTKGYTISLVDV